MPPTGPSEPGRAGLRPRRRPRRHRAGRCLARHARLGPCGPPHRFPTGRHQDRKRWHDRSWSLPARRRLPPLRHHGSRQPPGSHRPASVLRPTCPTVSIRCDPSHRQAASLPSTVAYRSWPLRFSTVSTFPARCTVGFSRCGRLLQTPTVLVWSFLALCVGGRPTTAGPLAHHGDRTGDGSDQLIPRAVAALWTPALLQTAPGCWPSREQTPAIRSLANPTMAWVTAALGLVSWAAT